MPGEPDSRSAHLAAQFEAAQDGLVRLVESLTDDQWRLVGKNYPQRINDEDEGRTVGVIAHHVATSAPWIMGRIQSMLDGKPPAPADIGELNTRHAAENTDVTREEVLQVLRESGPRLAAAVRAIPDDQLDQSHDTPAGPMSIAQRVERVLIGHLQMHQGSIETTIR